MNSLKRLFFFFPFLVFLLGVVPQAEAKHCKRHVSFGVQVNCQPAPLYVVQTQGPVFTPAPVAMAASVPDPVPFPAPMMVAPYGVPVYYTAPVVVPAPRPYVRGAGVVYYKHH